MAPKLKSRIVSYIAIDYGNLDEFVQEVYNNPSFSCVESDELRNDQQKTYVIHGKSELGEWDQKAIKELESGQTPSYVTATILQDLVNKDLIPPGSYLLFVCW